MMEEGGYGCDAREHRGWHTPLNAQWSADNTTSSTFQIMNSRTVKVQMIEKSLTSTFFVLPHKPVQAVQLGEGFHPAVDSTSSVGSPVRLLVSE